MGGDVVGTGGDRVETSGGVDRPWQVGRHRLPPLWAAAAGVVALQVALVAARRAAVWPPWPATAEMAGATAVGLGLGDLLWQVAAAAMAAAAAVAVIGRAATVVDGGWGFQRAPSRLAPFPWQL